MALAATLSVESSTVSAGVGRLGGLGRIAGSSRGGVGASSSTVPDSWAREGEGPVTVVDVEVGIGVGGLVGTGELDHGAGAAVSAVHYLDLNTGCVVLGLVDMRAVDTYAMSVQRLRRINWQSSLPICSKRTRYSPLGVFFGIVAPIVSLPQVHQAVVVKSPLLQTPWTVSE